jgi:hypothetical protein
MKHLKLLGVALAALFAFGITTTTALALPDISLTLTGSSFPLRLDVTLLTVKTELNTIGGTTIDGEGFLLLLLASSLTSLGTFEALFTKVVENGKVNKCKSFGDPEGEVLTKGTYDIVYTSLAPLTLGLLFLVEPLTIMCSGALVEFDLKGSMLASINPFSIGTERSQIISILGVLKGNGKGKPSLVTYYNDGGTAVKAKLEGENGTGSAEAAVEVQAELTLLALKTNMFVITGR